MNAPGPVERVTATLIRERKNSADKIVAVTAWDYWSANAAEEAGAEMILVGDSLAMTIRGEKNTLGVTVRDMLYHTKMVARACERAMVVADMPFMSYQINPDQALVNAGRFLKQASAHAVKIDGGRAMAATVEKLTSAGIPVLGHIGLTPQSIHQLGGFKVQGKDAEAARDLFDDAVALETAGAFAIVVECVPAALAEAVTEAIGVPTIGIGAGAGCDGQIQVTADVIGLTTTKTPKHARKYVDVNAQVAAALRSLFADIKSGAFPGPENVFDAPRGFEPPKPRTRREAAP